MAVVRVDNQQGTIAAGLNPGDVTIQFSVAPGFPSLTPGQTINVILDPAVNVSNPSFEIAVMTAFTAGSTTGTVNPLVKSHNIGATWLSGPVAADFTAAAIGADASGSAAAAQAAAQASSLQLTGGTMSGPIVLPANPTTDLQAAPKQYVDSVASGLAVKATCICATTSTLPSNSYLNGTLGVGATLTATARRDCSPSTATRSCSMTGAGPGRGGRSRTTGSTSAPRRGPVASPTS